jgi:hypothetical protein
MHLLWVPAELLIAILIFGIILALIIAIFVSAMNAKAKEEIKDQPGEVKQKSDPPGAGKVDDI